MIQTKKQMYIIISIFAFITILGGITYAWFNYRKEGNNQRLIAGNIYLYFNEDDDGISLSNIFPETKEEARSRDDNYLTFDISGLNESNKTLYYEIDINHGTDKESPYVRFLDEDIRFDLVELDSNGNEVSYLLDAVGFDTLINKRIYVDSVAANSSTEISRKYKLRMWLSDEVIVSDTDLNSDYPAVGFKNYYTNIKLIVIGDFTERSMGAYYDLRENADTVTTINFSTSSSSTNGQGLYLLNGTENDNYPIYYYRGSVTNNNVIFAGYCWQMVRTTDTGGIKMIYNGVATGNGKTCENSLHADRIIGTGAYNTNSQSMSDIGYMSNTRYVYHDAQAASGSIYGKDIEWNGTSYLVIEDTLNTASTNTTLDEYHHYTCGTAGTTSCTTVRYYYYEGYYVELTNGELLSDVIYKMTGTGDNDVVSRNNSYILNYNNSTIKTNIDTWFETNLTNIVNQSNRDYRNYLEDTAYCNDRSFKTVSGDTSYPVFQNSGWNPLGGSLSNYVFFGTTNRYTNSWFNANNMPSLTCSNPLDRFTVSSDNGNGALTYPVGLLTADEIVLSGVGGNGSSNTTFFLHTGGYYWTMSPRNYNNNTSYILYVRDNGNIVDGYANNISAGIRPVISLKLGVGFESGGDGTTTNPYIVK